MFKKNKLIGIVCLIMAALVSFSSCSKEQQIVGKWKITKARLSGFDTTNDLYELWTFKDGGKCVLFIWGDEMEGKYSINNNTLYIDVEFQYNNAYSYRLTGNLDFDEFSQKEMSVSGKVMIYEYYYGDLHASEQTTLSYDLEKK